MCSEAYSGHRQLKWKNAKEDFRHVLVDFFFFLVLKVENRNIYCKAEKCEVGRSRIWDSLDWQDVTLITSPLDKVWNRGLSHHLHRFKLCQFKVSTFPAHLVFHSVLSGSKRKRGPPLAAVLHRLGYQHEINLVITRQPRICGGLAAAGCNDICIQYPIKSPQMKQ